jgi:hypothetical protein
MGIAMADIANRNAGDTLVIEDRMRTVWATRAFGVLFSGVPVVLMLFLVAKAVSQPQAEIFAIVLFGFLILGFVALSGVQLLLADHHRTTFDRATRQITLAVTNPKRQLAETYAFADVQTVGVVQWPGSRGKVIIRPVLNLTGEREVHTIGQSLPRADAEAAVAKIAQFLAVPQDTLRDGRVAQVETIKDADADADGSGSLRLGPDLHGHWRARVLGLVTAVPVTWAVYSLVMRTMVKPDMIELLIGGFVLSGFVAITCTFLFAPIKSTTVDAAGQVIKLQQVDCLGRHTEQVIAFADVKHMGVAARNNWRGGRPHQLVLNLRDGRELAVARAQPFNDAERTAKRLAQVVGVAVV